MPSLRVGTAIDAGALFRGPDYSEAQLLYGEKPNSIVENVLGRFNIPYQTKYEKQREKAILENQAKQLRALDILQLDPEYNKQFGPSIAKARESIVADHAKALATGTPTPGFPSVTEQQDEAQEKLFDEAFDKIQRGEQASGAVIRKMSPDDYERYAHEQNLNATRASTDYKRHSDERQSEAHQLKLDRKYDDAKGQAMLSLYKVREEPGYIEFVKSHVNTMEAMRGKLSGRRPPELSEDNSKENITAWAQYLNSPHVGQLPVGQPSLMDQLSGSMFSDDISPLPAEEGLYPPSETKRPVNDRMRTQGPTLDDLELDAKASVEEQREAATRLQNKADVLGRDTFLYIDGKPRFKFRPASPLMQKTSQLLPAPSQLPEQPALSVAAAELSALMASRPTEDMQMAQLDKEERVALQNIITTPGRQRMVEEANIKALYNEKRKDVEDIREQAVKKMAAGLIHEIPEEPEIPVSDNTRQELMNIKRRESAEETRQQQAIELARQLLGETTIRR